MNPRELAAAASASDLLSRYRAVRQQTEALAAPLSEADCQVQSMPDASPVRWHLAHVTWFFETFILEQHEPGFVPHHPAFRVLFNSYYNGVGDQHPRPQRGLVTRPGLAEVLGYRRAVDERMARLLAGARSPELAGLVELGLQHEQQHQELILTDLRHLLSCNPLDPVYSARWPLVSVTATPLRWVPFGAGLHDIGHDGDGFAFDNEGPRHRSWLQGFELASRLVTHGEWADFVADGAYAEPRWWLAAGWDWVREQRATAPMYWRSEGAGTWSNFTLHGRVPLDPLTPVVNINLYEADAYARWHAAQHPTRRPTRLPTEAEWERAAGTDARAWHKGGNFLESGAFHPLPVAEEGAGLQQMLGDTWEWTSSGYAPYPGFAAADGAVGEYNGKFMVNQYVLRGGSCATPRNHLRTTYRNFFPAQTRWQFSGLRLARDLA